MDTRHALQPYVGRWAIHAATRPPVWPFLRDALIEVQHGTGAGDAFVRVRTAGGALLRGFTLAWRPADAGIILSSVECNGCRYDLALALALPGEGDRRRHLSGTWSAIGAAGAEPAGNWTAQDLLAAAEYVAA